VAGLQLMADRRTRRLPAASHSGYPAARIDGHIPCAIREEAVKSAPLSYLTATELQGKLRNDKGIGTADAFVVGPGHRGDIGAPYPGEYTPR
jgi:hypothetical protein